MSFRAHVTCRGCVIAEIDGNALIPWLSPHRELGLTFGIGWARVLTRAEAQ